MILLFLLIQIKQINYLRLTQRLFFLYKFSFFLQKSQNPLGPRRMWRGLLSVFPHTRLLNGFIFFFLSRGKVARQVFFNGCALFPPHLKQKQNQTKQHWAFHIHPVVSCLVEPMLLPTASHSRTTLHLLAPISNTFFAFLFCGASFKVLSAQVGFSAACKALTHAVFCPGLPLREVLLSRCWEERSTAPRSRSLSHGNNLFHTVLCSFSFSFQYAIKGLLEKRWEGANRDWSLLPLFG